MKISTNENLSHFDPTQITHLTFDDSRDAVRVTLVDGLKLTADSINIPEQRVIEIPVIVKEMQIVEVPTIVQDIQIVNVPQVITEYKTIEVPVIIREIQVVEVEKPIVIKETEFKIIEKPITPYYVKVCIIIQTAALIGLMLTNILRK